MGKKLDWVRKIVDQTNLEVTEYNREAEAREVQISQTEVELTEQILEKVQLQKKEARGIGLFFHINLLLEKG